MLAPGTQSTLRQKRITGCHYHIKDNDQTDLIPLPWSHKLSQPSLIDSHECVSLDWLIESYDLLYGLFEFKPSMQLF